MTAFLGRAQLVCCTVESMSMLTEAIVAQRPVIGLIPQQFSPEDAYQQAIHRLMNRRWLATQPIETWTTQHLAHQEQLKPMRQSALQQLALQLKTRLMNDL
jgi:mitochondrial fission protein ELM1